MRCFLLLIALSAGTIFAQDGKFNHVQWKLTIDQSSAAPGAEVLGHLQAVVDPEWHMYSLTTPPGPIPTTIKSDNSPAVDTVTIFEPPPVRKFDPGFGVDTETYEGAQNFLARIRLKKDLQPGPVTITFVPRYQTCSGTTCIPPRTRNVTATLNIAADAPVAAIDIPAGYIEGKPAAKSTGSVPGAAATTADGSLAAFLALAFGFGLAAIFTPCVFPMIPITMSYFIGQRGGLRQAIIFCLGIIVLFSALGLILTLALGPAAVVQLGSNAWVNGFIALIFFVFGLSLLGAFEITIPSSVLTKLNAASGQGGTIGTLLMGLTFALASFACVGPFMGTLLAASVGADKLRPVLGMVVFASGLALPFFLLALFPNYLQKLPRSGEWLARVKVVMGFLVLAAMLKYLYSLDAVLQTGFLTRERFLAAWVVLFAMAGFYLLGFVRLPGISRDSELGVGRLLTGIALVVFGLSLVPGMFGSKLGEIEAYIPPASGTSFGGGSSSGDLPWIENDLNAAFAKAKAEGKTVLVNFTGYACTNCHWMKANMFTKPEVGGVMKNMVLVDLYTDGTDAASQANQKLEEDKFQTVAIPFYVLYDANQNVLATFPGLTRKPEEYLAFLNTRSTVPAPAAAAASAALDGAPFKTLEGAALSPADWKGKVVVVNYWATWCVPCRSEIPEFNKMHDELKDVEIVGIEMGEEGMEAVKPFLEKNPMKYTVGIGSGSMDQLPVTLVLDRNGNTIKRFDGLAKAQEIRAAIAKAQNAV
ncbi:MAG TPA: cytochrome c biogenesis protein CcdA [Bryobacteraceae bacterium]|jgi:thiol:disulfide interchange protein DsbD|nr:cytochrome c biogenesis protein CcdA [Bryobacteraceae bacterium]